MRFIPYVKHKFLIRKYCSSSNKNVYSNTVILPKTKFPLRLNNTAVIQRDEQISKKCKFNELYSWQRGHLSEPEFVLHDGPPYANGVPHMGHAINKILKDTILRYHILKGNKIHYVPGWDCHGLPIELKALTSSNNLSALEVRKKAKSFATKTLEEQKKTFQSWGVTGDWNNSYTTYSVEYIKNQFEQFYKMYSKKLIYKDVKPIYWSPSSKTALAEAELEYNDKHKSPSAYVRFKVEPHPEIPMLNNRSVFAPIWTTTPWTLPSNQAVCYNPTISYSAIENLADKNVYIVATDLISELIKTFNWNIEVLGKLRADYLSKLKYHHPIYKNQMLPFLPASHATSSKGTGLVHTAPAHGPDDFLVALNKKMSIIDLVNEEGRYRSEAGSNLEGKFVLTEGNEAVIKLLSDNLIHLSEFEHSYPYDWRTKEPVIIRASPQWFVDTNAIKSRAVDVLQDVKIIPKISGDIYKQNLINQIEKRPYWCISRQRKWGAPIPVLYKIDTEEIIVNEDIIHHQCQLLKKHGPDFWWTLEVEDLIPEHMKNDFQPNTLKKGEDIMDIWFDSGISWSKVLDGTKVADMYLEGVDQFTGWFQSSLLTSVAIRDKAPYKTIYVHGFAVDENGVKMSKSVGNVVNPDDITKGKKGQPAFGIDVLRWWVAVHANQDSISPVSTNVMKTCADEVQKIRGVLRFILGSLNDYSETEVDNKNLLLIDRYMLHVLYNFHQQVSKEMVDYQFNKVGSLVLNLLTNQISALYYSSIKDRLYCELEDSTSRRSAQFVLLAIFDVVGQAIAPIVPHLIEEMNLHLPFRNKTYFTSKHVTPSEHWKNEEVNVLMEHVLNVKKIVNKEVGAKTIDSDVEIVLSGKVGKVFKESTIKNLEEQLEDILQVSKVKIDTDPNQMEDHKIITKASKNFVCPRCRKVNSNEKDCICSRCDNVVTLLNNQLNSKKKTIHN